MIMMMKNLKRHLAALACILMSVGTTHAAITIAFDYTLDEANDDFFSNATAKASLEAAADFFEGIIMDSLTAISPDGAVNIFNAFGTHPATGVENVIYDTNVQIPANTLKIYAAGRSLGDSTLGVGGPGGYSMGGSDAFKDNFHSRGQSGITNGSGVLLGTQTDFAPWGGTIVFDNDATLGGNAANSWHYDHTTSPGGVNDIDFFSVALHELGHVLGFSGGANSWTSKISGSNFTGADSTASFGGNVPLANTGHWAEGTMSVKVSDGLAQEAAMDPTLTNGTRKLFTNLDVMGLNDIGWNTNVSPVPEPSFYATLVGFGLAGFAFLRRRFQA